MTTDTLNFPVFHSDQGVGSDTVQFTAENKVADVSKAKDFELAQAARMGDMASFEEIYRRITAGCIRSVSGCCRTPQRLRI